MVRPDSSIRLHPASFGRVGIVPRRTKILGTPSLRLQRDVLEKKAPPKNR